MSDFIKTAQAEQAFEMCQAVLGARQYSKIGQITGDPGTGKSELTTWLAEELGGVRVECWMDMGDKALLEEIAMGLNARGASLDVSGTAPTLFRKIKGECAGKLIIIDEANQLKWATLEKLRGLSDIGGAGLILAGTALLSVGTTSVLGNENAEVETQLAKRVRGTLRTPVRILGQAFDERQLARFDASQRCRFGESRANLLDRLGGFGCAFADAAGDFQILGQCFANDFEELHPAVEVFLHRGDIVAIGIDTLFGRGHPRFAVEQREPVGFGTILRPARHTDRRSAYCQRRQGQRGGGHLKTR